MPNWVSNIITMSSENNGRVQEVLNFLKSKRGAVDFNKICPMPKSLDVESSSISDSGYEYVRHIRQGGEESDFKWRCYIDTDEKREEAKRLGEILWNNEQQYGCRTWYTWCIQHWGTKWNACDAIAGDNYVKFDTAWAAVPDLVRRLSNRFPDVRFDYMFADEDWGCNTGEGYFIAGESHMVYPSDNSEHATSIATEMWGEMDYDEEY